MKIKRLRLAMWGLWGCVVWTGVSVAETANLIPNDLEIERIEDGGTLYFKSASGGTAPKPMKTGLFELQVLGSLSNPAKTGPYFVLVGRTCQDCMEEKAIFIYRPGGMRPQSFVYPGKIFDPKTRSTLMESQAFFGHCLNRVDGDVFVEFLKERVDRRRHLQPSVYVAQPGEDHLHENLIERRMPQLVQTQRLKKQKRCTEIEGRNRLMLAKALDLHPRKGNAEDDDKEDEDDARDQSPTPGSEPEPAASPKPSSPKPSSPKPSSPKPSSS